MGDEPSEGMRVYVLMQGLPASWRAFADSLTTHASTKDAKFDELVAHLEDYQEKEKIKNNIAAADEVISYAHMRGNGGRRQDQAQQHQQRGAGGRANGGGGAPFHARGHQQQRGGRPNGGAGQRETLCYSCDQPGHRAFDCPTEAGVDVRRESSITALGCASGLT